MKKITFNQYFTKTNFKKFAQYHLGEFGTIKKITPFDDVCIFHVETTEGKLLFHKSYMTIQSCIFRNGKLLATYFCKSEDIKYFISEIEYFKQNLSDQIKMKFPEIELKKH